MNAGRNTSAVIIAVSGAFLAGAAISAQVQLVQPVVPPRVLTGGDFGFRVEGLRGGTPVGRFVVRVKDEWIEVDEARVGELMLPPAPQR